MVNACDLVCTVYQSHAVVSETSIVKLTMVIIRKSICDFIKMQLCCYNTALVSPILSQTFFGFASRGKVIYCFGIAHSLLYRPLRICSCGYTLQSLKPFCEVPDLASSICFFRQILCLVFNSKVFELECYISAIQVRTRGRA